MINSIAKKPRYDGYVIVGRGHDSVRIPIVVLPNKFQRWFGKFLLGLTYLDQDGKEI